MKINIEAVLKDPAISFWLKDAIIINLGRDPLNALDDAELLVEILQQHYNEVVDNAKK